mmetsp:Transcript_1899/g.2744  ORF Transcript_1899/g.2744 Transcript_1899/m.2744 type:complete len:82 (-) Transcript_1899:463-708(-)
MQPKVRRSIVFRDILSRSINVPKERVVHVKLNSKKTKAGGFLMTTAPKVSPKPAHMKLAKPLLKQTSSFEYDPRIVRQKRN